MPTARRPCLLLFVKRKVLAVRVSSSCCKLQLPGHEEEEEEVKVAVVLRILTARRGRVLLVAFGTGATLQTESQGVGRTISLKEGS